MSLAALVDQHLPRVTDLRRRLHRIPELGYEEHETAAFIRAELTRLNVPHVAGVDGAPTATVAWVGDTGKPCVALRADIDALPILERTGLDYASERPGRMHACGHDGHTANLLGVAALLRELAPTLPVCVKLLWQPAEEGGGGAKRMIDAGVLDGRIGPNVSAIFGLHGWPGLALGKVASKPGAILAATDNFEARFVGSGCHGAYPHLGRDPIVAAAEAIVSLQSIVAREFDPTDSAVVTVGIVHGGTAVNVIPDVATISGTARTLHGAARKQVEDAIRRRCEGVAHAAGCTLQYRWYENYPPTINDPKMTDYVARVARRTFGDDAYVPVAKPSMGGEDFAYYLEAVPGNFFLVGVQPSDDPYPPLHSDRYDFTDAALAVGMRMFVELVTNFRPT